MITTGKLKPFEALQRYGEEREKIDELSVGVHVYDKFGIDFNNEGLKETYKALAALDKVYLTGPSNALWISVYDAHPDSNTQSYGMALKATAIASMEVPFVDTFTFSFYDKLKHIEGLSPGAMTIYAIENSLNIFMAAPAIEDPKKISFFTCQADAATWKNLPSEVKDDFRKSNAVMTKPGRFFRKFGIEDPQVLEEIASNFQDYEFDIVEGEQIRELYLADNYTEKEATTLHSSCMKYNACQEYLDLYVNNCKMLVSFDEHGKIYGRAIIWPDVGIPNDVRKITFMDRIYGSDMFVHSAKRYAREQGWYHKVEQNYTSMKLVHGPAGNVVEDFTMKFEVPERYNSYPFLDTFRYAHQDLTLFSNSPHVCNAHDLCHTDGSPWHGGRECVNCGSTLETDDDVFMSDDREIYCETCYTENYYSCDICNEEIPSASARFSNAQVYCPSCADEHLGMCEVCCEYFDIDDATIFDDITYCPHCFTNATFRCETCGSIESMSTNLAEDIDDASSCPHCREEAVNG